MTSYYGPANATDGDPNTAWGEGASESGEGEWIAVEADTTQAVHGIKIINGYAKNSDLFQKNNRVRDITIRLSDGTAFSATLEDSYGTWQVLTFGDEYLTSSVTITIDSVYEGTKWDDTLISELLVY